MKISFCIFLSLVLSTFLYGGTIYGIILADTKDPGLGNSNDLDQKNISKEINIIGEQIGYEVALKVFMNENLRKAPIEAYIQSLALDSNDIVIFYFSGHGESNMMNDRLLNLEQGEQLIFEEIKSSLDCKKSKFNLLLTDCCSKPPVDAAGSYTKSTSPAKMEMIKNNYKRLFNHQGTIVFHSSGLEKASFANKDGGIFTQSFLQIFRKHIETEPLPSWLPILQEVENQTVKNADAIWEVQKPFFKTVNLTEPQY